MKRLPLLVGEQNQISNERHFDLYPLPDHSTGGRLCREILGVKSTDYLRRFERRNLLGRGAWNCKEAARIARQILEERGCGVHYVLLGAKVCAAFGVVDLENFSQTAMRIELPGGLGCHVGILRLPHPSGRCRIWNDPASYERAREALRAFLPGDLPALIGAGDKTRLKQGSRAGLDTV